MALRPSAVLPYAFPLQKQCTAPAMPVQRGHSLKRLFGFPPQMAGSVAKRFFLMDAFHSKRYLLSIIRCMQDVVNVFDSGRKPRPIAAMRRTVPAQYRSGFIDIRSRICYDFPSRFIAAERKRQLSIHAALPRMNRFFHARRNRADSPFCQGRRRNLPCHAITIVLAAPCGCWPSRRCCF